MDDTTTGRFMAALLLLFVPGASSSSLLEDDSESESATEDTKRAVQQIDDKTKILAISTALVSIGRSFDVYYDQYSCTN